MRRSSVVNAALLDLPTLGAISLVVGVLGSLIHEGLGHAGAALLLGAHGVSVGSAVMQYQPGSVTALGQRLIALAGPLASAAQGLVGLAALRRTWPDRTSPGGAWYFWWLLGHVGLFTAAGYLLALSFAPFGDVHEVVQGLSAETLWRTLATLLGALLAYRSMVHAARTLAPHLPPAPARRPVLARLTLIPYLLGGLASVLVRPWAPTTCS